MEISEDHPNENKQKLFIQRFLQQGNQPPSPVFGRVSKADIREGKAYDVKKKKALDALIGANSEY